MRCICYEIHVGTSHHANLMPRLTLAGRIPCGTPHPCIHLSSADDAPAMRSTNRPPPVPLLLAPPPLTMILFIFIVRPGWRARHTIPDGERMKEPKYA